MKRYGLSGSALKIIACVLMTIDHIGSRLLPQYAVLRLIGRLAFPIFAFCIAQGARYTRNKARHLGLLLGFGVVWECVLIAYHGMWKGNIFLTFSLSTVLIYLWQYAMRAYGNSRLHGSLALAVWVAAVAAVWGLTQHIHIEYRFWGIMAAVAVSLPMYTEGQTPHVLKRFDRLPVQLILLATALFLQAFPTIGRTVQVYSIAAVGILAFYDGTAGNKRLKYAFYVFYPLHLIVIGIIQKLILAF